MKNYYRGYNNKSQLMMCKSGMMKGIMILNKRKKTETYMYNITKYKLSHLQLKPI